MRYWFGGLPVMDITLATTSAKADGPKPERVLGYEPRRGPSLKALALRGSIWTIGGYGASQVLRLGSNLILTRLLFPEAFGLAALVTVFMQGLAMFSDVGIGPAIIQSKHGDDPVFLNTAWTIQVTRGFGLWLFGCLAAWPAAALYAEPRLLQLIPVAGLTALIGGFNSTAMFTANRHFDLRRLTIVNLVSQTLTSVAMVVWAWFVPSVWSLVGGGLIGAVVTAVMSHGYLPGTRCQLLWDRDAAKALFQFGRWIFISTFLTFWAMQGDRVVLGKLVALKVLAVYSIACMLRQVPAQLMRQISSNVLLPAVSRVLRAEGNNARKVKAARYAFMLVMLPACALLVASGATIVHVLYDSRYANAGELLGVLAAGVWLETVSVSYGTVLLSAGRPRMVAVGVGVRAGLFFALVWPAFHSFGVWGVALLTTLVEIGVLLPCMLAARRLGAATPAVDALMTVAVVLLCALNTRVLSAVVGYSGSNLMGLVCLGAVGAVTMYGAHLCVRKVGAR